MGERRSIVIGSQAGALEEHAAQLLAERARVRTTQDVSIVRADSVDEPPLVVLGTPSSHPIVAAAVDEARVRLPDDEEGFGIVSERKGPALIAAREPIGLVFGAGRLLRDSHFRGDVWELPTSDIASAPAKKIRPIYFATHFGNWYCHASEEDLGRYLEDLLLWGYNALVTWFDMHHYRSFEDGAAAWDRLVRLDKLARAAGMKVGRIVIANESFDGQAPPEWRAVGRLEGTGYDTDLCPSQSGARELILADRRAFLERTRDTTELDWICLWPYDQGGCNCDRCTPWPDTYLSLGKEIADLTAQILPDTEVQVSAWWIGTHRSGEDEAFFARLERGGDDWFKTIAAGSVELRRWLRDGRRIPDRYDVLLFPEISMFDALPWGSRGGNPAPARFAAEMAELGSHINGAMPYSEGRYEDVNKALWAQLQWDPDRDPMTILEDYCRFELGGDVAQSGASLLSHIEEGTHDLPTAGARFEEARRVEDQMERWGRVGWRWKVLRGRAAIDALRAELDDPRTSEDRRVVAEAELRRIYEELQHEIYLHDEERSLENWIYSPFDVWLTLPLNELRLPTGVN